jgi:hypothetical protein
MFRSNALADRNITVMSLTLATFQPERSALKAWALENIELMSLRRATFQPARSALKVVAS